MNKKIEKINSELVKIGLELAALKGSRKNGVSKKNFKVFSHVGTSYMGSDGESNWSNHFYVTFSLDSMKELSLEKVEEKILSESGQTLAQVASEVAEATEIENARIQKIQERIRAENEAKAKARAEALQPVSEEVQNQNIAEMRARMADTTENKLRWYQRSECSRSIVSDEYRNEFLRLIADANVIDMAKDLLGRKDPKSLLDKYDMMLNANNEARSRGVVSYSIGGVSSALRFLVGVNSEK